MFTEIHQKHPEPLLVIGRSPAQIRDGPEHPTNNFNTFKIKVLRAFGVL